MKKFAVAPLMFALSSSLSLAANAPQYAVVETHPAAGNERWDLLAVDSARHHLFISRSDHVQVLDTRTGAETGRIDGTDGVHGIEVEPNGHGWTTNGKSNSVTEFDLQTFKRIRDLPVSGKSPDAILYDAASKHLFVFNARSNSASVLDPDSGKEIATLAFDGNPELAVADGKGRLFVNIESNATLAEIDTKAMKILHAWKMEGCEEPSGIALDEKTRHVFSTCQNQVLAVTDARDGHAVARVPIGEGPDGAAFDPATGSVLVPNGKSGTLSVVKSGGGDRYGVQTVPTRKSARNIVLDSATHRAYLPAAEFEPAKDGKKRGPMVAGSFNVLVVAPAAH